MSIISQLKKKKWKYKQNLTVGKALPREHMLAICYPKRRRLEIQAENMKKRGDHSQKSLSRHQPLEDNLIPGEETAASL